MDRIVGMLKSKKGQGFIEYIILLSVLIAALVLVSPQLKQTIEGGFTKVADQIGTSLPAAG